MTDAGAGREGEVAGVTVVIPVYNEAGRLAEVVAGVLAMADGLERPCRVLVVNDGSTDWTGELERRVRVDSRVMVRCFPVNRGKGAVLNDVFPEIDTPYVVVIDADNEYPPADIPSVLDPLVDGSADWVLGVRYGFGRRRPGQYLSTYMVNRLLSMLFSLLSGICFRDMMTGLYAFRTAMLDGVRLSEPRFAYTPELLWKVQRLHRPRWRDVPVSYLFRGYGEGKKIRWWETFTVLYAILRYRSCVAPASCRSERSDAA
jgi:glycosyltransferase involved in cell wall biosynthesis